MWPLARRAGARVIAARAISADAAERRIYLEGRPPIAYDTASFDVGERRVRCGATWRSMRWSRPSMRAPRDLGAVGPSQRSGVQYPSIRYTERLAEAGIEPSVGSTGDSYDKALAETVIGSFKT